MFKLYVIVHAEVNTCVHTGVLVLACDGVEGRCMCMPGMHTR